MIHYRIHKAYDRMPEPERFLLFMVIAVPGIMAGSAFSVSPPLALGGIAWLLALLCSRAYFLHAQCRYNPWTRKRS